MNNPRGRAAPDTKRTTGTPFESVALLLQGGGALGSYQAGVYQAISEAGIEPSWIAGISIGAINSAIIVGNAPENRVAQLRAFWELVSDAGDFGLTDHLAGLWSGDRARGWINQLAAGRVMSRGAPGFFEPRMPPPYLMPKGGGMTSYYDTSKLRGTLERLVDFDRINAGEMRFSVGAVNVRTGNFAYFDNVTDTIRAEHVMASGALPPAFAAVEIDGECYWDGGMVSNTPLEWVLSSRSDLDTLVLQVDLWSARGALPRDLTEVAVRMKEVQYSSRTRAATDEFRKFQKLRAAFNELMEKLPPELAAMPAAKLLAEASDPAVYNIVQLVYRSATYEGQSKDFEFSRRTMEEHWRAGYADATATLDHPEVLTPPTGSQGVAVYDFLTPGAGDPVQS
ncbi:MAG: patatin-like phospholipase family protein [Janthinobacterium lividum]